MNYANFDIDFFRSKLQKYILIVILQKSSM